MKVHLANSNTWSDGNEYVMSTASEVHTNALFDIYPNDTSITAEFKGNTQQSGTPSPSAPVPVVGVGFLDGTAYKIPVEIGLSTQSIDLSTVTSRRLIKKLVLDGTENWNINTSGSLSFFSLPLSDIAISGTEVLCTHFANANIGQSTTEIGIGLAGNAQLRVRPDNPSSYNLNTWKNWLTANQPIVYYVLAAETTAIINEPLQKIGNYADTISNITLTTTAGATSFGVDTAVKPSEITLNFRGWHPKDPKESSGGEWI